jgi:hypothetical protein
MSGQATKKQEKYNSLFMELVLEAARLGVSVEGKNTGDMLELSTLGEFDATKLKINLYFDSDERHIVTPRLIFTLAHELQHVRQFLAGRTADYWLHCIGCGPRITEEINDKIEKEADEVAVQFCKSHKIPIPEICLRGVELS